MRISVNELFTCNVCPDSLTLALHDIGHWREWWKEREFRRFNLLSGGVGENGKQTLVYNRKQK